MDDKLVKQIVALEDERHYLENLLEYYYNETEDDLETIIQNRISTLYEDQKKLEDA